MENSDRYIAKKYFLRSLFYQVLEIGINLKEIKYLPTLIRLIDIFALNYTTTVFFADNDRWEAERGKY